MSEYAFPQLSIEDILSYMLPISLPNTNSLKTEPKVIPCSAHKECCSQVETLHSFEEEEIVVVVDEVSLAKCRICSAGTSAECRGNTRCHNAAR